MRGTTKIRLIKALVWPVATYRCEIWILRQNEETRLDAFEMKKTEKNSAPESAGFVDSIEKNEWVHNKAGVKRNC